MAELNKIEEFLEINTENKQLRDGKKNKTKNQYFYYKDQFYIVKLTQEKWMIATDDDTTRRLLRMHFWQVHPQGYAATNIKRDGRRTTERFHRLVIDAQDKSDHINRNTFDNRVTNLRDVTIRQNNRNLSKRKDNTSSKQGVCRCVARGWSYWRVQIRDNEGKQISKYFSIAKLGEDEAKRQAINKRVQLERLYGYIGD